MQLPQVLTVPPGLRQTTAMRLVAMLLGAVLAVSALLFFTVGPDLADRAANRVLRPGPYPASPAAQALHRTLVVADLHADPLLWGRDLRVRGTHGHVDLPRLREGGVALQVFSAVTRVPSSINYEHNDGRMDMVTLLAVGERWPLATWASPFARALHQARTLQAVAADSGGRFVIVTDAPTLQRVAEQHRRVPDLTGGLLAIEGLHAIEGDLHNLDALYDAGFRMMGLTHFFDNEVAGSAHGAEKGGLTAVGREAIRRMEARGVLLDLAHASPRAFDEALALARRPVVVSHAGVRGTCDNTRNLSDAQLRAVAANGGVVGIGFWETATCGTDARAVARSIAHAVRVAGPDHVALGSDFDGAVATPFDATGVPQVTEALVESGLDEAAIAGVMGANAVRLLRATLP